MDYVAFVDASPLILIAAAEPVVERLRDAGMYLSDEVTEQALLEVGE